VSRSRTATHQKPTTDPWYPLHEREELQEDRADVQEQMAWIARLVGPG
jgi:hypothetical protein